MLRSGRLEVVRESPPPTGVVRQLGRGAAVGELALVSGSPRSASARAVRDSELIRIDRERILELLHDSPPFAVALTRAIGRLLQASEPAVVSRRRPARVVALVPLQADAPVRPLGDGLLEAIRPWADAASLAQDDLDVRGLSEAERFAARGRLLDRCERDHDYVILVGGHGEDAEPWNAYAMRQADRVVAVGLPRPPPGTPGCAPVPEGCELVLWGGRRESAGVIAAWLRALRPRTHHLVDPADRRAAVARTARRLLGRSTGLVLSGGGAGGLAHAGVLAVLVEGGVAIDRVGGASFGALTAGLFAMGHPPDEILDILREELVRRDPFTDYALPLRSLLRARKAEAALRRMFGHAQIEQLPLDCFCVSSDLLTAEVVVQRRGSLADAARASMSVPGLAPPVARGGRLLVDGGVLANLPVEAMAAMHEGPIIAVDVMRRRLRPDDDAPLNIYEVLSRSSVLGSWREGERHRALAQLVIAPDARGIGFLDFGRLEDIVRAGRVAAEEALDRALALAPGALSPL